MSVTYYREGWRRLATAQAGRVYHGGVASANRPERRRVCQLTPLSLFAFQMSAVQK